MTGSSCMWDVSRVKKGLSVKTTTTAMKTTSTHTHTQGYIRVFKNSNVLDTELNTVTIKLSKKVRIVYCNVTRT